MATVADVVRALRFVIDPEIGINVIDLGLVYGLELREGEVRVQLGVTAPTCPLSELLVATCERTIARQVPDSARVVVTLVTEPPWEPEMMSDEARRLLA